MRPRARRVWFARDDAIDAILDHNHKMQKSLAAEIGLSSSYVSEVLRGRRAASRGFRARIAGHPLFQGVASDVLWRVQNVPVPLVVAQPGDAGGRAV